MNKGFVSIEKEVKEIIHEWLSFEEFKKEIEWRREMSIRINPYLAWN